jgi:hypothetical protein
MEEARKRIETIPRIINLLEDLRKKTDEEETKTEKTETKTESSEGAEKVRERIMVRQKLA